MTLDLCMPTAGAYCQRGAVGPRPMVGLLYEVGISDCSLVLIYYLYINLDNITDIVSGIYVISNTFCSLIPEMSS